MPQWTQGEVLIGETGRSQGQRNGIPENHLMLYQDKNFTLFYIRFKPTKEKFRLLLLPLTSTNFVSSRQVRKFLKFQMLRLTPVVFKGKEGH